MLCSLTLNSLSLFLFFDKHLVHAFLSSLCQSLCSSVSVHHIRALMSLNAFNGMVCPHRSDTRLKRGQEASFTCWHSKTCPLSIRWALWARPCCPATLGGCTGPVNRILWASRQCRASISSRASNNCNTSICSSSRVITWGVSPCRASTCRANSSTVNRHTNSNSNS